MPKTSSYTAMLPDSSGRVPYTAEDDAVWRDLMARQLPSVQARMATPYLDGLRRLDLPTDRVAQCNEVSARLADGARWPLSTTNWAGWRRVTLSAPPDWRQP